MIHIEIGSPVESDSLQAELPEGLTVKDTGQQYFEFDDTGFSLFMLTIGIVGGIPAGVVANAIYDAIKKRAKKPPTRIIIDKQHVEFDREKITRVVHERIEYHRGTPSDEDK